MGPANERVIAKIQALDEGAMVELMKTIEGVSVEHITSIVAGTGRLTFRRVNLLQVMATLPQGHEGDDEAKEAEASPLS